MYILVPACEDIFVRNRNSKTVGFLCNTSNISLYVGKYRRKSAFLKLSALSVQTLSTLDSVASSGEYTADPVSSQFDLFRTSNMTHFTHGLYTLRSIYIVFYPIRKRFLPKHLNWDKIVKTSGRAAGEGSLSLDGCIGIGQCVQNNQHNEMFESYCIWPWFDSELWSLNSFPPTFQSVLSMKKGK